MLVSNPIFVHSTKEERPETMIVESKLSTPRTLLVPIQSTFNVPYADQFTQSLLKDESLSESLFMKREQERIEDFNEWNIEAITKLYGMWVSDAVLNKCALWIVYSSEDKPKIPIGVVSTTKLEPGQHLLNVLIFKDYCNNGYATEATKAVVRSLLHPDRGASKSAREVYALAENKVGARVFEKIGFRPRSKSKVLDIECQVFHINKEEFSDLWL